MRHFAPSNLGVGLGGVEGRARGCGIGIYQSVSDIGDMILLILIGFTYRL